MDAQNQKIYELMPDAGGLISSQAGSDLIL